MLWQGRPKYSKGAQMTLRQDAPLQKVPNPPVVTIFDVGELWTSTTPRAFKGFVYKCKDIHDNEYLINEAHLQEGIHYSEVSPGKYTLTSEPVDVPAP